MSTTTLNIYYSWATTTLFEISLENKQFSVIKVPLSSRDEPFILSIPETVITEEGCNGNGRLFDERTTPELLCKDINAVFHCFGIHTSSSRHSNILKYS
jgi:hypothetical protein